MSNAIKAGIVVLTALLVVLLIIIWTLQRTGRSETPVPAPTPSISQETQTPEPDTSTPAESGSPTDSAAPDDASPSPSASPTDTAEPSPSVLEQSMLWEGKATFEYFSVELTPNHQELESIPGLSNFEVEVCVLKPVGSDGTSRVSVEPWWLESEKGEIQRPIEARYEPAFPAKDALAAGECTKGWLAFNNFGDTSVDYTYLIYQNGLGERAVWSFH